MNFESTITWTGDNLQELLQFTGKHERFDQWFNSFKDYAECVRNTDNVFKLFTPRGVKNVRVGDMLVKDIKTGTITVWRSVQVGNQ